MSAAFPQRLLPGVAYQEYAIGGHLIDDSAAVSQLSTLDDELRDQTVGSYEGMLMITELADAVGR